MQFWDKLTGNAELDGGFSCLAPMDGVTDCVFRQVVMRAARPDVFFTEFTNVDSYVSERGRANALARLRYLAPEQPIVAQIWGNKPDHFHQTALGLKQLGYQALDINMGCPDRHVVANGGGSDLIRHPALAKDLVRASKNCGLAVSVKTRLGYTHPDEYQDWLAVLLAEELDALTIHLRTKKDMSKVDARSAYVEPIIQMRNQLAPKTKLIINGDIKDIADGKKYIKLGADGIMIGRGVFQNPFCFELKPRAHTREELFKLLGFHLDLYEQSQDMPYEALKRFFKIYINNFPSAANIRASLMETHSLSEARKILDRVNM